MAVSKGLGSKAMCGLARTPRSQGATLTPQAGNSRAKAQISAGFRLITSNPLFGQQRRDMVSDFGLVIGSEAEVDVTYLALPID